MTKKSFITPVLSTIGGILFALGMCLLPEWNVFPQGVAVAAQMVNQLSGYIRGDFGRKIAIGTSLLYHDTYLCNFRRQ